MILNDDEIQGLAESQQLLSNYVPANIKNCAYVLTIGNVFRPETGDEEVLESGSGLQRHFWEIGPSETLVVMTQESVRMPAGLCAAYAPLFRLAKQGVLLLNASLVEPGYEGPLSCFLVNFSAQRIPLRRGGAIAKIIFHQVESQPSRLKPEVILMSEYKETLAECAKNFHRSFMDVAGIASRAGESASAEVRKWVFGGGVLIAFLLLWASVEPLLSNKLWQKFGIMDTTHRVEDAKLGKDLESAQATLKILMDKERDDQALKSRLALLEAQVVKLEQRKGK